MKRFILHSAFLTAGMITFSLSCPIQAQGILDTGRSLLSGANGGTAGIGGTSAMIEALPLDKIMSLLQKQGYSNITGLGPSPSGDTLQATTMNSSANPVNLLINPTTGGVISALAK